MYALFVCVYLFFSFFNIENIKRCCNSDVELEINDTSVDNGHNTTTVYMHCIQMA